MKYTNPYPVDSGLMSEPPYDSLQYKGTQFCSADQGPVIKDQPETVARHGEEVGVQAVGRCRCKQSLALVKCKAHEKQVPISLEKHML